MPLEEFVQAFLDDPENTEQEKDSVRALMSSHRLEGAKLRSQGRLREAIQEYAKDNDRPIRSSVDKEIVQGSYSLIGMVYRELGETEQARGALEKALELWRLYRVGISPHDALAEIFIESGELDEAIAMCKELLTQIPEPRAKELLNKAQALKGLAKQQFE